MTPVKYDALNTIVSMSSTLGGAALSFNLGQIIATDAIGLYLFSKAEATSIFTQYYFANATRAMAHEIVTTTCLGFVANVVLSVALTVLSTCVMTLVYNIFIAKSEDVISLYDLCSHAWGLITFSSKNQQLETVEDYPTQEMASVSIQNLSQQSP